MNQNLLRALRGVWAVCWRGEGGCTPFFARRFGLPWVVVRLKRRFLRRLKGGGKPLPSGLNINALCVVGMLRALLQEGELLAHLVQARAPRGASHDRVPREPVTVYRTSVLVLRKSQCRRATPCALR